jgi:molybdopterin converting factor small subunit
MDAQGKDEPRMSIRVQLTYDMSKALGVQRFEIESARSVADVVEQARSRFRDSGADFEKLTRVAAVAVNGVLINHRKGMKTRLGDGDTVAFLKAAAGG